MIRAEIIGNVASYKSICYPIQHTSDATLWNPRKCAVFFRSKEKYGALSNMSMGMPISVYDSSGLLIESVKSSEHLYQAGRFMDGNLQRAVLDAKNAMVCKHVAHEVISFTREDWQAMNVEWMLWVVRQKLGSNWDTFGTVLESTEDRPIVEQSFRDGFWGAKPREDGLLEGRNVLGQLLMRLRSWKRQGHTAEEASLGQCPIPMTLLGKTIR